MSLHIIKCKTILKINEIETINLTQYLNFHRHTETGGKSMCVLGLFRGPYFYRAFIAVIFRGIQSGSKWRSSGHILSCELGIWLAHSQNPFPGELSSTSPSKDRVWNYQSSLKSVRNEVSAPSHLLVRKLLLAMFLCPPLFTCTRAASLQPGFISLKGLTQYCQGWLAPNWNDTFFFPSGPAITVTCGGGFNVKANVFLMFLSLKEKEENHKWKPADKAEPVTQASTSSTGFWVWTFLCVRLGGLSPRGDPLPETYPNGTHKGRAWNQPLCCAAISAVTGIWILPNNMIIFAYMLLTTSCLLPTPAIRS